MWEEEPTHMKLLFVHERFGAFAGAESNILATAGAFVTGSQAGMFPVRGATHAAKVREIELNKKFHRLVVATQFMKEELLRNGFTPEQIEIHPPVPLRGGFPLQSSFSDRNLIIYAGQVTRGKGVDVLIESLAHVHEPFECFIFGDGNHRAFCEKLSRKLDLAQRVHFKGYVPPDELKTYYRECSVAVVSSVWPEPFGAVGLEAMRHGLPVVAFDAGGIKEWLIDGKNGFLVPWMNRVAFARRVAQLLHDKPLARKLGGQGRQMVTDRFEFSKYIDGLENLFTRAADKARQPVIA